ncbi:fluoride efflux transporter CrcB [Peribacillus tepidiphilus]|uniref:fluoride efflux transporter CrcB n=1 Tax=Peribacillus tepidiphilus TaxID=2652445 RepID=UPI001292797F|nr:fluoride efflux transporter CrcB [Peribacillus tepidiphilus]
MKICMIVLGAFVGGIFRFLLSTLIGKMNTGPYFPISILVVNLIGSFILGFVLKMLPSEQSLLLLFMATGLLGSFTTFSTFSMEAISLLERRDYRNFFLYITITMCGSVFLFILGFYLPKILL